MPFQANRGGHAPGHLREWFEAYLDAGQKIEGELAEEMREHIARRRLPVRRKDLETWLFGQLWNCHDVMPSLVRQQVQDLVADEWERRFTYGQAVRALKTARGGSVAERLKTGKIRVRSRVRPA